MTLKPWRLLPFVIMLLAGGCAYRYERLDRGQSYAQRHFATTPAMRLPRDNPQTPQAVALGAALFAETRLSIDGTRACASCHRAAPYMHDGSLPTLAAVVDHYSDHVIERGPVRRARLSARDKGDLIAFLQTLDSGARD